ncbi:alkaline phosphatase D family protein [Haloferula sp.]|uniref:alkaline phosphatase D family protein n=1 Tax=Haloferula sp. TaxID=2497595 RepID=UPI003C735C2C
MKLPNLLLFVPLMFLPGEGLALGFANGVKIGELTHDSVVIWTRLTKNALADHQVEKWDPETPHWQVPGQAGELRVSLIQPEEQMSLAQMPVLVDAGSDFCHQVRFTDLDPATRYTVTILGTAGEETAEYVTSFRTAPLPSCEEAITFTVSTCQDFPRRDDKANGHKIYKSMLAEEPDFFVQTGDTLYYDKPDPFAKDLATARYKWNRIYALPFLREFHKVIPSYWMHDDHDVLKDDCWPGQKYGDLTWDQGLKIWSEQVPQSDKPYRTFRWGKHLQIWLPEGREYRSPNTMEDGPEKSILGKKQWKWLEETMKASDATFKLYVSATPVVGPDRKGKNDNHANKGFRHEGKRLREFLSAIPGCFVINGDRHWQYHSIDPDTQLNEFGSGPASNVHAGGFNRDLKEEWQPFLRIKGGYLSVEVDAKTAKVVHHDVDGMAVNEVVISAP